VAVRAYVVFALAVMLGTAYWLADQFGWTPATKARASSASAGGTFHALRLPRTYAVDLDTGKVTREGADLHWRMETRDRPYLAPFQGALIALSGDVRWEKVDVKHLAGLDYAVTRYSAAHADAPVQRGTVVAVRTSKGNLAKFRIVAVSKGYDVDVEWVLYPGAPR
jgi:hypothetical protein